MSGRPRVICFLRHHNDIDHITPVLWKLSQTGRADIHAVVSTRRELLNDDRLVFLRTRQNTTVSYIEDHLTDEEIRGVRDADPTGPIVVGFDDELTDTVLDRLTAGALCTLIAFDWIMDAMPEVDFVDRVVAWARPRSIPVVSLPHGDAPYANRLFKLNYLRYEQAINFSRSAVYDAVFVPNSICAARYTPHMPAERVLVCGSPRYNTEWLEKLDGLSRQPVEWRADAPMRIAFFLRHYRWPIFWEEVERTIEMARTIDGAAILVQHHPRDAFREEFRRRCPALFRDAENVRIDFQDLPAREIARWSNVTLDIGTSAVFDAIQLRRSIISLEYLHACRSVVSHHMPGAEIRCRDELLDALLRLRADPNARLYPREQEDQFIDSMIHTPDADVLSRYARLLCEQVSSRTVNARPSASAASALQNSEALPCQ